MQLELESMLECFGGTVLWVSHDRAEVERHCRQVAVIDHGLVGRVTTLEELRRSPATVAEARMAGCRNFTACTVSGGVLHAPGWGLTLPCAASDGDYTLGLPDDALVPGEDLRGQVVRRMASGQTLVVELPQEVCPAAGQTLTMGAAPDGLCLISR